MTSMRIIIQGTTGKFTTYVFENQFGTKFFIDDIKGHFSVSGNRAFAKDEFKQIHRQPPDEYGTFYGRDKAGQAACRELISKYSKEV